MLEIFTGEKFHQYYSPGNVLISQQSEEIHGLTNDFLDKYNTFESEIGEFLNFIDDSKLIIHNAQFDLNMINSSLRRTGNKKILFEQAECTLEISKKKFPGSKNNLNALCRRFGINLEDREKHSAITDCFLLLQVYHELNGGKQVDLKFEKIKENTKKSKQHEYKYLDLFRVKLSEEEISQHKKMLHKLNKNLW